jgi:hypothetical protein
MPEQTGASNRIFGQINENRVKNSPPPRKRPGSIDGNNELALQYGQFMKRQNNSLQGRLACGQSFQAESAS